MAEGRGNGGDYCSGKRKKNVLLSLLSNFINQYSHHSDVLYFFVFVVIILMFLLNSAITRDE